MPQVIGGMNMQMQKLMVVIAVIALLALLVWYTQRSK